ncbi:hypothetical protein EYF80_056266 [Liparis tanakae]|uniref:Uncharacterized protein n=1 Tax=Liparis tanakae TaxID=230148 RepID=A0A4Z2EXL7_9TELE|nr:hypothetical protein EYF80_056266 [Liparis tanakae]
MSATTRVGVKQGAFWVTKGPLPFGGDVLLLLGKRPAAVVSEEGLPVTPHEALHALTPPAGSIEGVHRKRRLAELRVNTLTPNAPPEGKLLVNLIHIYVYVASQVSVAADLKSSPS